MKKFFTLAIAVLAAVSVNAQKYQLPLDDLPNGWGSTYDPATKTITYSEGDWGGRGWNMSAETPYNFVDEGYDYVIVKIKSATINPKIVIEYTDGTKDDAGNFVKTASSEVSGDATTTYLAAPFDVKQEKLIQIYIQNSSWTADAKNGNPAGTVVLEDAYLATEDTYKADLDSINKAKGDAIWEGNVNLGSDWSSNFTISADKFATAEAGSKLTFQFTDNADATYYQLKTCSAGEGWPVLTSNKSDLNPYDCKDLTGGVTEYSITLNADDVAALKASGLAVSGYGITVTKVLLSASATNGIKGIKPATKTLNANAPMYNLAGQRVTKAYKGVVLQNGHKFFNK